MSGAARRFPPVVLVALLAAGPFHGRCVAGDTSRAGEITKVVIVRHAEKDTVGPDPRLTAAGRNRAGRLARILADEPVSMLISSDRARTIETLEPLSAKTGLGVTTIPVRGGPAGHAAELADSIRAHPGGTIVVSNHSNVIPEILHDLGVDGEIRIPDDEYERIFIVVLVPGRDATLLMMRFGT